MSRYFIWVTVGAVLLLGAEVLAGRHKGSYRWRDAPLFFGSMLLGRLLAAPAGAVLAASVFGLLLPPYKNALVGTRLWIAFPAILLIEEFCFYWVHRWAHNTSTARFPVLWKIHRTHHSAPYMNLTLYFGRLNLFWYFIIPTLWTTSLALYLGLSQAATAVTLTIMIWNAVTHCHFRWDDAIRRHPTFGSAFRALEHVIVTPGLHHTHHGYGRDGASYRNFCTMLSCIDWAFGTLHIPEGRPSRYGLPGNEHPHWLEELLYPLVQLKEKRAE